MKNDKSKADFASRKTARVRNDAVFASMDARAALEFFAKRGFSTETIEALVAHGIMMPEELLFMPIDQMRQISFVSAKHALAEIETYRDRFLGSAK